MIIDNTYLKGEIYIPHAKPGIKDSVTGVETEVISFISEYANDCLFKCLGPQLHADLLLNLDENETTWVDALADAKWNDLVNGKEYVDPVSNLNVVWKGIRYTNLFNGSVYDRSFLAYYVYFFYEKKDYVTRAGIGHQEEKPSNATLTTPTQKVVNAWNKFVTHVQGDDVQPVNIYSNSGLLLHSINGGNINSIKGIGLDYFKGNSETSLYKFIEDSNIISEGTYANFKPKFWTRINQFGI
jgi:hypothetical protein